MAIGCFSSGLARKWSDPVRVTQANENHLSGNYFRTEVDSRDDIHLVYAYQNYQDEEDVGRCQPVYQKFNRFGEPLSDPVILARVVEPPDSHWTHVYDLFCDQDDNIHVLWGVYNLHYTMLNREGEILIPGVHLQDVTLFNGARDHAPRIAVDSDGNIIFFGQVNNLNIPVEQRDNPVVYGRYTLEGDLIDTLHVLHIRPGFGQGFRMEIGNADTLYLVWMDFSTVHYSKVSPDDEIVFDNVTLAGRNENNSLVSSAGFALDSDNRLVFIGVDNRERYLVRYNEILEMDFTTYIGRSGFSSMPGDISIDNEGCIHIVDDFDDDNFNNGRYSIGYAEFNNEGNIVDSLQFIHDGTRREGGHRPASWSTMQIFSCPDGTVGIIWDDDRFDYRENGEELFMRFSAPDNDVIVLKPELPANQSLLIRNYPNPFNSSTKIDYDIPITGIYSLTIYNVSGRIVFSETYNLFLSGKYSTIWKGIDIFGNTLPTGIYIVKIAGNSRIQTIPVSIVR